MKTFFKDLPSLSNISEYPTTPRPPQEPIVIVTKEEVVSEPVVEETPVIYEEPIADVYEETPIDESYPTDYTEGSDEEQV